MTAHAPSKAPTSVQAKISFPTLKMKSAAAPTHCTSSTEEKTATMWKTGPALKKR